MGPHATTSHTNGLPGPCRSTHFTGLMMGKAISLHGELRLYRLAMTALDLKPLIAGWLAYDKLFVNIENA